MRELKRIGQNANVEAIAQFIKRRLKDGDYQTIILTGLSDSGKIVIVEISHRHGFKPIKTPISPGEIKWHYAFSYVDPAEYIEELFGQLTEFNRQTIAALAHDVNVKCSVSDVKVSEKCRVLSITRE